MFKIGDYVQMIRCPEYSGLVLKVGAGGSDVWVLWNSNNKIQMHKQWFPKNKLCKVDKKCPC